MRIFSNYQAFEKTVGTPLVLTIGTFDGVHFGHRQILKRLNERAKSLNGESALLTFHPHPREVLFDDKGVRLLNTQREKTQLLQQAGLDNLIVHPFTKEFSKLTPEEYVKDILVNHLQANVVIVGYDHHFGHGRKGGFKDLVAMGQQHNFQVEEIAAQEIDAVNVSSTKIRKALLDGNVELANEFLGYPFSLSGVVVQGKQIGRTLGYPTANIQIDEASKLTPSLGVYAGLVEIISNEPAATNNSKKLKGLMSIGTNPTIAEGNEKTLEVHLLDFDADIYDCQLKIEILHHLRPEQKFENVKALTCLVSSSSSYQLRIHVRY